MKKIFAAFLAALMLLTVPMHALAAEGQGILSVGSASAFAGDTVRLPVQIESNPGIVGCRIRISYDSSILTLQSVENDNLFNSGSTVFGNDLAEIPYNLIWEDSLSASNHTDVGTFATLVFAIAQDAPAGDTAVSVAYDQGSTFDTALEDVVFETRSGSVTVKALQDAALAIKTAPAKTEYWAGETLDTTGLVLTYTDNHGISADITEGFTCTPTTLNTAGTQTVTVSYEGLTATFSVTVKALLDKSLAVKTVPAKTEYWAGETLDTTGLVLTYTDIYGTASEITEGFTCTPTTLNTAGTQTVTVSYEGLTATFTVTVKALLAETLTVKTAPTKTAYQVGETLDTTGLVLTYTDNHGISADITEGFTCTPTTLNTEGIQTITVSYAGLTATFTVTVEPIVQAAAFALGSDTAAPGETVEIPLRIEGNPGIAGLRLFVAYDANVLSLREVRNANLFSSGTFVFGNDLAAVPYGILWEDSLSTVNHTENGDLLVLTFLVLDNAAAGDTAVTVTYDAGSTFDVDLNSVSFETHNGVVTVEQAAQEGGWSFAEGTNLRITHTYNDMAYVIGVDLDDPVVLDYVETTGGWTADVELNDAGTESTGAILHIYDADSELVESYPIVVFGDINGDTMISIEDSMLALDISERAVDFDWAFFDEIDETPQIFATDVNHDYNVTVEDAMFVMDCSELNKAPNQIWAEDNDPLYMDEL